MIRFLSTLMLAATFAAFVPQVSAQSQRYQVDLKQSTISYSAETSESKSPYTLDYGLLTANGSRVEAATISGEFSPDGSPAQRFQFSLKTLNPIRSIEGGANYIANGVIKVDGVSTAVSRPVKIHFETGNVSIDGVFSVGKKEIAFKLFANE